MSIRYFLNVYIKPLLLNWYWHRKEKDFECAAGYACGWTYPYGFVPEADCPVHDK